MWSFGSRSVASITTTEVIDLCLVLKDSHRRGQRGWSDTGEHPGRSTSNLLGLRVLDAADTRIVHHKCTIEYAIKD